MRNKDVHMLDLSDPMAVLNSEAADVISRKITSSVFD